MTIEAARNILLCLRYGIGDLIMETPLLGQLRKAAPAAVITALGARPAIELLEADERVDHLVCIQDLGFSHWGDYGNEELRTRLEDWVNRQDFDLILDPGHAATGISDILWQQPTPIFDSGDCREFLQKGMNGTAAIIGSAHLHWGLDSDPRLMPSIRLTKSDHRFAHQFLDRAGAARGKPLIALSPVASSRLKTWSLDRLTIIADLLIESGYPILLIQGPQQEKSSILLSRMQSTAGVMDLSTINLRWVAALLARCCLFLGNDTGLMHLAAAMGIPVVAIFGPTSPAVYLPPGNAVSLGGEYLCEYRKEGMFGPPMCILENRCLLNRNSCIDQVDIESVRQTVFSIIRNRCRSNATETERFRPHVEPTAGTVFSEN